MNDFGQVELVWSVCCSAVVLIALMLISDLNFTAHLITCLTDDLAINYRFCRYDYSKAPMRITFRQLQIFAAVALSGSTIGAAESISLSQSATSGAINELERTLNTRLFDRVGKRLLLNEHGRDLLPHAMSLINGAEDIERHYADHLLSSATPLRLAASTTIGNYVMPRLLASFRDSLACDGDAVVA